MTSRNEPDKPSEPKLGPKFHSDWFRATKICLALFLGVISGFIFNWATRPYLDAWGDVRKYHCFTDPPSRCRTKSSQASVAIVIGVMLGSSFTPALFDRITLWAPSLIFMVGYLIVAALVVVPFYRKIAGFDLSTAYFAGMPGGLMEMMIIGKDAGA